MFSLTNSTFSVSPAICSSTGVTALQGPHHGAQKSTTTGLPASSTSCSNVASVTSRIGPSLQTARQASQPHERHLPHRFEHDRAAHLRVAVLAVDERDRHLDHAEAGTQDAIGGLDLECVATGVDRGEVDRL